MTYHKSRTYVSYDAPLYHRLMAQRWQDDLTETFHSVKETAKMVRYRDEGYTPPKYLPHVFNLAVNKYDVSSNTDFVYNRIDRYSNYWCEYQSENGCIAYFSYDSMIAIYNAYNSVLYMNKDYIKYSPTTTKHMTRTRQYCEHDKEVEIDTDEIYIKHYQLICSVAPLIKFIGE